MNKEYAKIYEVTSTMDRLLNIAISDILIENMGLLRIPLRQRAKFEGWLKFELAHYLDKMGMDNVEVESKAAFRRDRTDITFMSNEIFYRVELKTSNTNWKIKGVNASGRPITKNIQSVIEDTEKLNSNQGIVAMVLFPIPVGDNRWIYYIDRIADKTGISIDRERNCNLLEFSIDGDNRCKVLVCTYMSKKYRNW